MLGQLFRYRAPANHIHHESLLVVFSTVLPTASDWQARLGFYPINSTGEVGNTWFVWKQGRWERPAP